MDNKLTKEYGDPREIRYLVNSLDDLRDVVGTIIHIIRSNCHRNDSTVIENSTPFKAIPINSANSSFVLSVMIPGGLLETRGNHSDSGKE